MINNDKTHNCGVFSILSEVFTWFKYCSGCAGVADRMGKIVLRKLALQNIKTPIRAKDMKVSVRQSQWYFAMYNSDCMAAIFD